MSAISGWGGRVQVNIAGSALNTGTAMPVTRWTVNDRADAIDVTTMEHAGYADFISGVNEFDISFECFYDTLLGPFSSPPNLNPGASAGATAAIPVYVTVALALDRAVVSRTWYFTRVLVTDVSMDDEVRGVVRYTVQGKATRGLSFVSGSTPAVTGGITQLYGATPPSATVPFS